jgi:hypothetical protein
MKHLVIIAIFLLSGLRLFSQDGNLRFIRFDNYSVEQDKLVQDALKNEKVAYTCIPSGIIAVVVSPEDPAGEERIVNLITSATGSKSFAFIPSYTLKEAESSCAVLRVPGNN